MALAEVKVPETQKEKAVFRHIVAAIDFSEASQRALRAALALAAENDAALSLVHVLQNDWRYEMLENPPELDLERIDAERRLKYLIGDLGSKKIDSILVKHGPVAPAVLAVAEESRADLLVAGTHGRGGISKFALGSVAEELLRTAQCPVMTVGPKAETPLSGPGCCLHTILFATDFGPGSDKALPLVLRLTKAESAKLILLHMIAPMPAFSSSLSAYAPASAAADELERWDGSMRKRALELLRQYVPAKSGLQEEPQYLVGTDFLPEGLLTAAGKYKVDLIVMGANRTAVPRVAAHIPWSAVHEVLASATCPVLTVAG